jgi:hypothetical protein
MSTISQLSFFSVHPLSFHSCLYHCILVSFYLILTVPVFLPPCGIHSSTCLGYLLPVILLACSWFFFPYPEQNFVNPFFYNYMASDFLSEKLEKLGSRIIVWYYCHFHRNDSFIKTNHLIKNYTGIGYIHRQSQ